MVATYPNLLAGGITLEGDILPFELYAGESDIVTSQFTAGEAITQFDVLVCSPAGVVTKWNGTDFPGGGEANLVPTPMGIAAQSFANGQMGPVFIGGVFSVDALRWPAGASTLAQRKAAFVGTNIAIGRLLGGTSGPMTLPPP